MSTGAEGKEHEIDQWLDTVLVRRASVEPRTGLENRVLATLQAERERVAARRRWWWGLGTAAVAATIVIAMWIGWREGPSVPSRAGTDSTASKHKIPGSLHARPERPRIPENAQARVPMSRQRAKVAVATRADGPKRNQFPSPEPLTDQEKMLARYVQEFPERAVLVARAQTQLRKEEERERLGSSPGSNGPTSSDQLE